MEIRTIDFGSAEHAETLVLRRDVLGDPGSPPSTSEEIASERDDIHLGLFEGDALVGCLVLTSWSPSMLQVRQVSVRAEDRRRGIGKALMDAAEAVGRERGFGWVVLYARDEAIEFYRALGYRYCDEWPAAVGIPNQMSAKPIMPRGL